MAWTPSWAMILNHDIEWWHIPWYWTTTLNLDTSKDIEPWHEIPHWIHDKNYNRSIEPWHKPQHDSWYWIMTLTMALNYNINHDIKLRQKAFSSMSWLMLWFMSWFNIVVHVINNHLLFLMALLIVLNVINKDIAVINSYPLLCLLTLLTTFEVPVMTKSQEILWDLVINVVNWLFF